MLNLAAMTQDDAQHTLEVYQWIKDHLQEIAERAENPSLAGTSAREAQGLFHQTYTCLESTRFLPFTIALFTDEDTLSGGGITAPNVLLYQPLDRAIYAVVDHVQTTDLTAVAKLFGISGHERAWQESQE